MIKRIFFSLFTGVLFGIVLATAPAVNAQTEKPCFGYCEHQILKDGCISDFAGCTLSFNADGNLDRVTCFYVNTCVVKFQNY